MKTINQRLLFSIRSGQISIKLLTKAGNQTKTLFGTKVGIRLYCTVLTLWLDLKRILPVLNFSTHSKFLYGYSWDLWFLFWMFIVSKNIHNFGYWYVNLFWWWYPALLLIPADFFLSTSFDVPHQLKWMNSPGFETQNDPRCGMWLDSSDTKNCYQISHTLMNGPGFIRKKSKLPPSLKLYKTAFWK